MCIRDRSEDAGMIEATKGGHLCLEKLEAMTAVCSVGLDMIVIPGDTSASVISGIIADEAAIGMVNSKTTAVRVIPAINRKAGEILEFGGLLGSGDVYKRQTFILVIASLVQLTEMIVKKTSPSLYQSLGVYLPLITTNCVVLNVALENIKQGYNFAEMLTYSIAIPVGFTLVLYIFSTIRERLDAAKTPAAFKGNPIALILSLIHI